MEQTQSSGNKCKKSGRRRARYQAYRTFKTREKNKVKRVLKSNGHDAAEAYALNNGVVGYFNQIRRV